LQPGSGGPISAASSRANSIVVASSTSGPMTRRHGSPAPRASPDFERHVLYLGKINDTQELEEIERASEPDFAPAETAATSRSETAG
jgi:hypothetical protein